MWPKAKFDKKISNFILYNFEKQVAPCVSTGREISFEWSHDRISYTDSIVKATLQNSIIHSSSERVNGTELQQVVRTHRRSCRRAVGRGDLINQIPVRPHSWTFTSVSVDSSPRSYLFPSATLQIPGQIAQKWDFLKCGTESIRYSTFEIGATLRYRNRAKITVLCVHRSSFRYGFRVGARAEHKLRDPSKSKRWKVLSQNRYKNQHKQQKREGSKIRLCFAKKLMDVLETSIQNCEIAPFQECTKAKKGLILKTD